MSLLPLAVPVPVIASTSPSKVSCDSAVKALLPFPVSILLVATVVIPVPPSPTARVPVMLDAHRSTAASFDSITIPPFDFKSKSISNVPAPVVAERPSSQVRVANTGSAPELPTKI